MLEFHVQPNFNVSEKIIHITYFNTFITERTKHSFKRGPKPLIRAAVWDIFQKKENFPNIAICKLCDPKVELKISRSSTTSLRNHARSYHKPQLQAADEKYKKSTQPKAATEAANKIKQKYAFGSQVYFLIYYFRSHET